MAGFSCVDFSNLNNKKKKRLEETGESGNTFLGVANYMKAYRPPLVVLENVRGAPWDEIRKYIEGLDYFCIHSIVDTKAYYLPQTRERGYMFCADKHLLNKHRISGDDLNWPQVLEAFKRPASSPVGMFILDDDDSRLEAIERDMAEKLSGTNRKEIKWDAYQKRHQSYRRMQSLGYKRPVTRWEESGVCHMPEFAWHTWCQTQSERVWDTIDANFLRKLISGYDINFKEFVLKKRHSCGPRVL